MKDIKTVKEISHQIERLQVIFRENYCVNSFELDMLEEKFEEILEILYKPSFLEVDSESF